MHIALENKTPVYDSSYIMKCIMEGKLLVLNDIYIYIFLFSFFKNKNCAF